MSKELEQQIADLQSQIAEKDKSFAELQATQETTAQTVAGLITERDEFKSVVEILTAAKIELETQLAVKTEEYVASIAKAAELQNQLVKVGRMILAIDKGLEKDEASILIEKWSTLSDEQFIDILDLASAAKTKKEMMTEDEMKKKKMVDDKKKSKAQNVDEDIEIDVVGEQVAETAIIEEKIETEVTPIAEPEVDKMIAVRANLQEYLSSVLGVK
jgi:hypothetical protein